jgi:hypothetical protein
MSGRQQRDRIGTRFAGAAKAARTWDLRAVVSRGLPRPRNIETSLAARVDGDLKVARARSIEI